MSEKGLARVEQICKDRPATVKRLKSEGKKIIGWLCCYPPLEILTAAGLVPYRMTGAMTESPDLAEAYVERIMCPYCRSCLDVGLKGRLDFLDGVIMPHSCDNIVKLYDIYRLTLKPSYSYFINVPHTCSEPSIEFFEKEVETYKSSIEKLVGRTIPDNEIRKAIDLHNQNRALVRELYQLKKQDPPLLSGTETVKILLAVMSIPVTEGNELLKDVIKEIKARRAPDKKGVRVLIVGAELDDPAFMDLIEESGAKVVMDDLCIGSRPFWHDVAVTNGTLKAISLRYLEGVDCPRIFKPSLPTYQEDLEQRFGHLRAFAEEYAVKGVIFYMVRFCDIFNFDFPDMRYYMEKAGFPSLFMEGEYTITSPARVKTLVQAFVETIS